MPGRPQIALLACLLAVALGGCGSEVDGTIPSSNSEQLITLLNGIENNVAGGECELAQDQADEFVDAVNELPAEVDDEVKGGLQDAAARLEELSSDPSECEETTGATLDNLEPTTTPTTTETPTTTVPTTTETEEEGDEEEPSNEGSDGGGPPASAPPADGGPPAGAPPGGSGPGSEGELEIEPPSEEDAASGGVGAEKGPRR